MFDLGGTVEDVVIERKDHGVRIVDFSSRRVEKQGVLNYVLLFRDHTGRKQMERDLIIKHQELKAAYLELEKKNHELKASQETLVQAGKMAALGELAAGIAHELNQPLMSIRGYAQELEAILGPVITGRPEETEVSISTREIISQADKMAKIISHLRTFTRRSTEDMEFVDVRAPVEEALKMLDRQFKSRGIEVERDFADDVPQVYANSLQLEQIFINLATNARDAIEQAGRGSGKIRISTRKVGQFAELRFTDDGIGMNDRTKQKAFNPFFTTKEVGKGMGLGLSLSYGMISKVQGSIRIESEVGSRNNVYHPASTGFQGAGGSSVFHERGNISMRYSVMIVDDEESIRRLLKSRLEREGYNVVTASSAEEAEREFGAGTRFSTVVNGPQDAGQRRLRSDEGASREERQHQVHRDHGSR